MALISFTIEDHTAMGLDPNTGHVVFTPTRIHTNTGGGIGTMKPFTVQYTNSFDVELENTSAEWLWKISVNSPTPIIVGYYAITGDTNFNTLLQEEPDNAWWTKLNQLIAMGGGPAGNDGNDGEDGKDGSLVTLTAGEITKLPPGSVPTVSVTGTPTVKRLNVGLVTGDKGEPGNDGVDGLDGANVLPTDTAVAQAVNTPASETGIALLRTIKPATGFDGVPLKRFRDALTQRKTRPVTISHIGDSITVGSGGGLTGRFASVLRNTLRTLYPTNGVTTGGRGFLSVNPNNYGTAVFGGGATYTQGGTYGYSPDHSYTRLDVAGRTVSWTIDGTGADILYTQVSPGGGKFYWTVDGGPQTIVDTNVLYTGATSVVQIRGLAAGAHTIEVGYNAAGVIVIGGLIEYNGDETSGFRSIVGGIGGTTTATWTGNSFRHLDYMVAYEPDLVVIGLGTNDFYHATAHVAATAYKANLLSLIQQIKDHTTIDPSIVLLLPAPLNAVAPLDPQIDYKTVAHAIAANDRTVSVFDWGYPMNPTNTATTAGGLMGADLVHPSPEGHQFIGGGLARHVGVV